MQPLVNVPLSQLTLSRLNVRRTGGADISQLAASIEADGLINQLTVARIPPDEQQPAERFEVIAGGRRLRAMQLLRDNGSLGAEHLVPVNIVDAAIATEIGLAENTVRERMHPHDEFVSFRDLAVAGLGPEDIAARFGVSAVFVQRRLRLANVSPVLLRAFREDKLNLEQMMAFALTDDHAVQERVFNAAGNKWDLDPSRIRAALTLKEVPTTDKRVRFVGLDVYEAAGGAVRRDLFDDAGGGYVLDEQLLDQLTEERLQREAKALADAGWSFVHIEREGKAYDFTGKCDRSHPKYEPRELSAEESARLVHISSRAEEIAAQLAADDEREDDQMDAEAYDQLADERGELLVEKHALQAEVEVFSDRQMAKAGCLIQVGYRGELEITRGLIPRSGTKAAGKAIVAAGGTPTAAPAVLSEAMRRRFSAHRQIALQASLLKRADVALATLAHKLLSPLFYTVGADSSNPCDISARSSIGSLHSLGFADIDSSANLRGLEEAIAELRSTLGVPTKHPQLWPWLLLQPQQTITALLALAAVMTVDAVGGYQREALPGAPLAVALDLDMAEFWAPTADTFFGLIPKSLAIEAVTEVHGEAEASRLVPMKKDECAGECERLMARSGWLPKPLRRPGYVPPKSATKPVGQIDAATPALKAKPAKKKAPAKAAKKPASRKPTAKKPAPKKAAAKSAAKKARK